MKPSDQIFLISEKLSKADKQSGVTWQRKIERKLQAICQYLDEQSTKEKEG